MKQILETAKAEDNKSFTTKLIDGVKAFFIIAMIMLLTAVPLKALFLFWTFLWNLI